MGNVNSTILCEEEIEELKNSSVFNEHEIEHLYERFCYLDKLNVGYLTYKELNNIPEFEMNPFNKLICNSVERMFDYQNISFVHFLDLVGIFNIKSAIEKRIKFLFDIFDLNRDGRLCKSVLKRIYEYMGCRDDKDIDFLLKIYDTKKKGYIDYKDFTMLYNDDPNMEKIMIIDFTKNIKQPTKVKFKDIFFPNFLIKKINAETSEEDNIEILISRLIHSEYLDDKYEALEDLEKYAHKNILETGTVGLSPLINSLDELDNVTYHYNILFLIFTSVHKNEFVTLLVKDNKLVELLFKNRRKNEKGFINLLLELLNFREFCFLFIKCNGVSQYCVNLIDDNNTDVIQCLIYIDDNFDKEIVFEGIFEKIINSYNKSHVYADLLRKLLMKNHFNQNYFIETEWTRILHSINDFVNILIDNTNNNIYYIKDAIYKYYTFEKALEDNNYEFIYKMIEGSVKYRNILSNIFYSESFYSVLNIENQGINTSSNYRVLNKNNLMIVLYYFLYKKCLTFDFSGYIFFIYSELFFDGVNAPEIVLNQEKTDFLYNIIIKDESRLANILLLFSIRNIDYSFEMSQIKISMDTILYYIILADTSIVIQKVDLIKHFIYSDVSNSLFTRLCILLCSIHNIKFNYNNYYLMENAKCIRKVLVNTSIFDKLHTTDEINNIIIDKLTELINKYHTTE